MKMKDGQPDCPQEDRWLDIAAGMEKPETAGPALAHASGCSTCGPRLREATLLLADQSDQTEQAFVRQLGSSQPAWQQNMAAQLASQNGVGDRPRARSRVKASWFGFGWRFAGVLVALLLLLFLPLYLRHRTDRQFSSFSATSVAVTPVSKSQAGKIASPMLEPGTKSTPKTEPLFASITLEPGLQRGLDQIPVLHLSPRVQSILVTLLFLDPPPSQLHIEMKNSSSRHVWSEDRNVTEEQVEKRALKTTIPASLLSADEYRIVATSSDETVATYDYRVVTP